MIKTRDLVPSIYYNKSRDFQAIGRVFEVLYNYAKTNTDLLLNSYEDTKMLDLLAKTLGFNSKHNYNTDDLVTLCSTFITIIKNKGSLTSINQAITALLKSQHIENTFVVVDKRADSVSHNKEHVLEIYIPKELTDLILLEDLFDYILPAGYSYRFIYAQFIPDAFNTSTSIESAVNSLKYDSNNLAQVGVVKSVSGSQGSSINVNRPRINNNPSSLGISYASVVYKPKSE